MSTLMVSISGVRGIVGNGLDPEILVKYTAAYAEFIGSGKIVIGRDSRISGEMVKNIVTGTLLSKGIDVIDIGICPTPTVQFNVDKLKADGGIVISASHNPNEWNALKLLNKSGQFLSPEEFEKLIAIVKKDNHKFSEWDKLGKKIDYNEGIRNHIDAILNLKLVDIEKIKKRKFKIVVDCVNGAGAYCVPDFLKAFGCELIEVNCDKTGIFPRKPEPIPENLTDTMKIVKAQNAELGIVVDPDVDRLVLITDKGEPFGEENTITQIVKFILSKNTGNVVVNLSTTRAVEDVAKEFGCKVFRSPVGEANVVKKMKEISAVIGGEGSGGVIYPELHYGRDALVGIALTLQHLMEFGKKISELKKELPGYFIVKNKVSVQNRNVESILEKIRSDYKDNNPNFEDGIKIDFEEHWVHFRKSNTEPIIRIIVEAKTKAQAEDLMNDYIKKLNI